MTYLALALSVVALLVALSGRRRPPAPAAEDAGQDARRRVENLREELEGELAKLRELLAQVADGRPVDGEMVREGRTWRDVLPTEAAELVARGGVRVVDVRSPQETAQGVLPGALLVPIGELESRAAEIPRDGAPTLVYCAGGGRSAAACEYLSGAGWSGLMNLQGGIQSWPGPVEKPRATT